MSDKQENRLSFEATLKQLESVVNQLENGDLALNEALSEFEKGIKLARAGQKQLEEAEQRIQILLSDSEKSELTDYEITHDA